VKDKLKERIDKLGIAIQNSGDRLEKIGAFIRDLSLDVGKLDKEVILSNVRLSFGDIEEEIKKIRKAISSYKKAIKRFKTS
jgi:predicted  nucleic acid-binding Zn-ribbon protein